MRSMMKRAQTQYSPVQLQRAVASVCEESKADTFVPVDSLPAEVLSLTEDQPGFAMVTRLEDKGKGTLDVFWGGGFGGYGILVCPEGGQLNTNRIVRNLVRWGDGVAFYVE